MYKILFRITSLNSALTNLAMVAYRLIAPTNSTSATTTVNVNDYSSFQIVMCSNNGKTIYNSSIITENQILNDQITRFNLYAGSDEVDFTFSHVGNTSVTISVVGVSANAYAAVYGIKVE